MSGTDKVIKYLAMAFAVLLIVCIIGGTISAVSTVSFFIGGGSIVGNTKSYPVSDDIEYLDIEVGAADLEIKTGDSFLVESNHKYLTVKDNNGKLTISEKRRPWRVRSVDGVKITLSIPADTFFEKVDLTTGAGKVSIDELAADRLQLKLGAGAVDIERLTAVSDAEIHGGTGKVTVRGGILNDLELKMGVGKLRLTSRLTGKCDINYGIGSTDLVLLGTDEDYQIKIDKGIGGVTVEDKQISGSSVYGNGKNKISIEGGIGSIKISFDDSEN